MLKRKEKIQKNNKKSLTDEVVEGSFYAALANFLSRFGALVFSIVVARFLFPENFGLYSLVMSIALIFMTFADLGIDSLMVRYLSLKLKKSEKTANFQYILKIKLYLSLIVSFALLILAYPLSLLYKKPELFLPLILSAFFIFTSLFVSFFSNFFYIIKKLKYLAVNEIIFQTIRMLLVVLLFTFFASLYHILGIFFVLIFANLLLIALLFFWISKFSPYIFKKSKVKIDRIRIIRFLGHITTAAVAGIIFTYVDTLILGFFVSFSYIGYYRVAFTLIFGLVSLFAYLGLVLLPFFTNMKGKKLENAFNKVLRFVLIFSIPSAFGALALGKYLILLLYGKDYSLATLPFYILSFMLISYIPSTILTTLFYSKEKPKYPAKAVLISLFLNIILSYILISQLLKISELYAITGAALATIISRYFLFFYCSFLANKKLNIKLEKIHFLKPIFASLIMFFFLLTINSYIKNMNPFILVIEIILGMTVYFSVMFLIKGFGKEDIEIIKKVPIFKRKNMRIY